MIDTTALLEQLNIADVVERYTGNRIKHSKTICPFHDDHRASLTLKTDKGLWRCWACGMGGNAINFVRAFYGLSFIEACKKLSEDFGVSDIGLVDTKTKRDIWDIVEAKCKQDRQHDLRQLRTEIDKEIDTLTTVHRVLFHLGYHEEAKQYSLLLDDLQDADLLTQYRMLYT